jgi:hypothetical protein
MNDLWFALPAQVSNPLAFLLLFRQDLCGSTYFHRLQTSDDRSSDIDPPRDEQHLNLDSSSFSFYYNYAPSQNDPSLQALSTLTERGASYSRDAGSGLALVEIALVDHRGTNVQSVGFPNPPSSTTCSLSFPEDSYLLSSVNPAAMGEHNSQHFLRIKITSTNLKRTALEVR